MITSLLKTRKTGKLEIYEIFETNHHLKDGKMV